jgi:hypothetical protein
MHSQRRPLASLADRTARELPKQTRTQSMRTAHCKGVGKGEGGDGVSAVRRSDTLLGEGRTGRSQKESR